MIQSDRGSTWRRWDLQVHTPHSHLNNSFGSDFGDYFLKLLSKAEDSKIAAIGLTDYFTIDGYREALSLLQSQTFLDSLPSDKVRERAQRLLFLPNIELRTNFLIQDKDGKDSRVNMHVIFSDEVSCDDIEEHFFREVKFWAEAQPQKTADKRSLTVANLTALGASLKLQHAKFAAQSDIFVGMMNAVIDAHEVAQVLADHRSKFEHKYLIFFPCDEDLSKVSWDGQGHLSRKQYVQMADILFSSNDNTRRFGLGKLHDSPGAYLSEFKSFKPCLHSSDSHSHESMFAPAGARYTWIKADVTFEGLRQVLHEPEHRVFIGEMPEQWNRVRSNPTRYLDTLSINSAGTAQGANRWFSNLTIPFSSELVAIIGKKGSGKSALSDIVGFAGNSQQFEHFSFLNPKRFWNDNKKRARGFDVTLHWHDKQEHKLKLSDDHQLGVPELVKYIPQNYLELICNEIEQGADSGFQHELQEVVFSHIPLAQRSHATTLAELIDSKNSAIEERLSLVRAQTRELTSKIVELEARSTPVERTRITNLLEERRREIAAHADNKPKDEPEPSDKDKEAASAAQTELIQAQVKLESAEKLVADLTAERLGHAAIATECAGLIASLDNLEIGFQGLLEKVTERAKRLGFITADLVQLSVNKDKVRTKKVQAEAAISSLDLKLDPERDGSAAKGAKLLKLAFDNVQKKLTEPEKLRQAAIQAKQTWDKRSAELTGNKEAPGSLLHLEERLKQLDALPTQLDQLRKERTESMLKLYDCIGDLAKEYGDLFEPVKKYFRLHKGMYPDVSIDFIVKQRVRGFTVRLLNFIDQSKRGAFRGTDDGQRASNELVRNADFQTREGVGKFIESVESKLNSLASSGVTIEEQLSKGRTKQELFDFLYDLDFIRPRFDLLWDGKLPEQLSPGERGSLLLVFYLVLDMRRSPLVIDQPEENLDNETIYKILVPCIMFAKRHRQVIMVTHNPNLAVAADADQIIYASVSKNPGVELTYECGAIENAKMTTHIINVLEGTKPAFKKREARYETSN